MNMESKYHYRFKCRISLLSVSSVVGQVLLLWFPSFSVGLAPCFLGLTGVHEFQNNKILKKGIKQHKVGVFGRWLASRNRSMP